MCGWLMDLGMPGVGDLGEYACVVGASHSRRSRRYTLTPPIDVTTLSSPGTCAQHPTTRRVATLVLYKLCLFGRLCVGADRRVRLRVAMCGWLMDLGMPGVGDLVEYACVVGASHACRSRRYTLTPPIDVATLSSPGPNALHSTARRVVRLVSDDLTFDEKKLCAGGRPLCRPARCDMWLVDGFGNV